MAATWRIVPQGQRQTTELSPAGTGFRDIWEVTYEVTEGDATGTVGIVRIPVETYSAETVAAAIEDQVSHLHNVASL